MSDQHDGPDPWDEGPGAMRPPTAEEEFFRDSDDDFDNEARSNAAMAAAAAGGGPVPEETIEDAGSDELSVGVRHIDESRRTTPATPLFDDALKARQEELSMTADRDRAGRVKALLEKIRTAEKKNDLRLNKSDIRGPEQSRGRGHGYGR